MPNKPNYLKELNLKPVSVQRYQRYLPTAFDDSLTITEKLNNVIHYLHEYSNLTEEMLIKWNEVYDWIMNKGLDNAIGDRLNEWLKDGTFDRIINEEIFGELNNKIDNTINEVNKLFSDLTEKIIKDVNNVIETLRVEMYDIGVTRFIREET